MQVVLDDTGSWTHLASRKTSIQPGGGEGGNEDHNSKGGAGSNKPHGMMGFLSRKKGRERSPKPQEPGVLGKEGARVVINSGGR